MAWGTWEDILFKIVGVRASGRMLGSKGGKGSFYTLGGVPWQLRTQFQEAKSVLWWSILSNRPGTAVGMELPCDKCSSYFIMFFIINEIRWERREVFSVYFIFMIRR